MPIERWAICCWHIRDDREVSDCFSALSSIIVRIERLDLIAYQRILDHISLHVGADINGMSHLSMYELGAMSDHATMTTSCGATSA